MLFFSEGWSFWVLLTKKKSEDETETENVCSTGADLEVWVDGVNKARHAGIEMLG